MHPGGTPPSMVIVCEVCETPQPPATVCAECGLALRLPAGVRPIADPPIERLRDLESTGFDDEEVLPDAPPPGFEETVQERAPEVIPDLLPNFEATFEEPLMELPGSADPTLPGIERTVEEFERTPLPIFEDALPCNYCGFVQESGKLCNNCGRSRLRVLPPTFGRRTDDGPVRCPRCGAKVTRNKVCSDCGSPLPVAE